MEEPTKIISILKNDQLEILDLRKCIEKNKEQTNKLFNKINLIFCIIIIYISLTAFFYFWNYISKFGYFSTLLKTH